MTMWVRIETPGAAAVERQFDGRDVLIGRGADARLIVPDQRMSRRHARFIQRDDGSWWLEDLGATNITYLNGEPLERVSQVHPGDRVQLGSTLVIFLGEQGAQLKAAAGNGLDTGRFPSGVDGGASSRGDAHDEDLDREALRLRTLNDVHRALAQPISLGALLDLILERCFELLRPEEGVIMLPNAGGELVSTAARRRGGGEVTVPRRLVDEVVGKGQPALVTDAAIDDRFAGSASIVASGLRSIVAAPLADAEGILGLIALASRARVRCFVQQDLELLVSIASAATLRVRNMAYAEEAAERRVLERELALAHDIQMSMLPQRMPERPEVSVGAALTPARSVGGDLFDVLLDGDRLWFIVADVAGKGVSAALFMAVVKTLFRAIAGGGADLLDVVHRMNRELTRDNGPIVFVTALLGCLELGSGALAVVDAGHLPPWVVESDGRVTERATVKCLAFAVDEYAPYSVSELTLTPGQTLVLYTDGVTDARSTDGDMFGATRLQASIGAAAGAASASELVDAVLRDVSRFSAGAAHADDIAMLAVTFRGGGTRASG